MTPFLEMLFLFRYSLLTKSFHIYELIYIFLQGSVGIEYSKKYMHTKLQYYLFITWYILICVPSLAAPYVALKVA